MPKYAIVSVWLTAALLVGCESIHEAEDRDEALSAPINCTTAEGDLRVLESEQAHVASQKAAGATSVSPASSLFVTGPTGGLFSGEASSPNSGQVEVGRYEKAVNDKIA
jgi:hypothetical protein